MMRNSSSRWQALNERLVQCRLCPRLVAWREKVAREKKRAFSDWEYWGKPVVGFGDENAKILAIGLAPGAHGSNRTGRMFTGDASGDFLYPALHAAGFANQAHSRDVQDGLRLRGLFISAVCRCAPPANKPTQEEIQACLPFLKEEIVLLKNLKGIVALGGIAFRESLKLLKTHWDVKIEHNVVFGHQRLYAFGEACPWLLASYHPSRQNTQTGRLTQSMFAAVWQQARQMIEE